MAVGHRSGVIPAHWRVVCRLGGATEALVEGGEQLMERERLADQGDALAVEAAQQGWLGHTGCHDHDALPEVGRQQGEEPLGADAWHHDIAEDEVDVLVRADQVESIFCGACCEHLKRAPEQACHAAPDGTAVVNEQQGRFGHRTDMAEGSG